MFNINYKILNIKKIFNKIYFIIIEINWIVNKILNFKIMHHTFIFLNARLISILSTINIKTISYSWLSKLSNNHIIIAICNIKDSNCIIRIYSIKLLRYML